MQKSAPTGAKPSSIFPLIRIGTLQWSVGALCLLTGALRLTAPIAATQVLQARGIEWSGFLLLAAGSGLMLLPVTRPDRRLVALAHLLAGMALLIVSSWYVSAGVGAGAL